MNMLAIERKRQIADTLRSEGRVVVAELAALYQVSEETIRRDLEKLEQEGIALRQYGGAVLKEQRSEAPDMPYATRKKRNPWGKQVMGQILETLVEDGDHLILDASSTSVAAMNSLSVRRGLTIITNSLDILNQVPDARGWEVISTGGTLMREYNALVGPRAVSAVSSMNADKLILSCKGLDMRKGVTDANETFSQVKQSMLSAAQMRILAADHTKFGRVAFAKICEVWDIDMVVTDVRPSAEWAEFFRERRIDVRFGAESPAQDEGIA